MIEMNTGDNVTFSLYGGINGTTTIEGSVQANVTAGLATVYPGNAVIVNHTNIWPLIPEEIREQYSNSHTAYEYVVIKTSNGTLYFIGKPWIREATVVLENPKTAELTISNFTDGDSVRLNKILSLHGYTIASFKINN